LKSYLLKRLLGNVGLSNSLYACALEVFEPAQMSKPTSEI
jgi:hypothetical protein